MILSYRAGTNNLKPDALSRKKDTDKVEIAFQPNIPPLHIVALLEWDLEQAIRDALQQEPNRGGVHMGDPKFPGAWSHTVPG